MLFLRMWDVGVTYPNKHPPDVARMQINRGTPLMRHACQIYTTRMWAEEEEEEEVVGMPVPTFCETCCVACQVWH